MLIISPLVFAIVAVSLALEPLPNLREQSKILRQWTNTRIKRVIPQLLDNYSVECWLLSMREYNEDPAFWGLVDRTTTFAARRRTLFLFYKNSTAFEWRKFIDNTENIWMNVNKALDELNPASIVLNIDTNGNNFADGIHAGEAEALLKHLSWTHWMRVKREPLLATQFIATRVDGMLEMYKKVMNNAHVIIQEGFSSRIITPGITTTEDVVWYFRDRLQSLNVTTWFQPSVDIQRYNSDTNTVEIHTGPYAVIQKGDLLWTDFGITFMGLNTDTQHNAYVLRDGETSAPQGLQNGLTQNSNIMQDLLMNEIRISKSGNDILATILAEMKRLGISGSVYCHPIGDFGHSAGPLVGMTNLQEGVPGLGELPVFPDMWFSVELQANVKVKEWGGNIVNFRQEEDMYLRDDGVAQWVVGRQDGLHLVGNKYGIIGDNENSLKMQEDL